MVILDIFQKQPFDIIAMTPRGTLGLCCAHIAQLMTHPATYTLPFTLQLCYKPLGMLQRVTRSEKVHISSHDEFQKLHNINFPGYRFWGFLRERLEKQEFPNSPITFFESNWACHTETHCGHSCCNKNFQILVISDLHQPADDANENHNYIVCLFIL